MCEKDEESMVLEPWGLRESWVAWEPAENDGCEREVGWRSENRPSALPSFIFAVLAAREGRGWLALPQRCCVTSALSEATDPRSSHLCPGAEGFGGPPMEAGPGHSVPAAATLPGKWKLVETLNGADLEVPWSCPRHRGGPMLSEATRMSAAQRCPGHS